MLDVGVILAIMFAALASIVIIKFGANRRPDPVDSTSLPEVRLGLQLQEEVRITAAQGHTEEAIKMLRKQAKLTPHEATLVVQAMMVGRIFPTPESEAGNARTAENAVVDDELLRRLQILVAQDPVKRTAAIQLLRDHTGMNAREARRFVNAL